MAAIAGEPLELNWLLPVRRENEASRLLIQQLTPQSGTWSSSAENLEHAAANGWELRSGGRSGNCWFAGPNGYKSLVLSDLFVPDATASLSFWMQHRLGTATFRVAVSDDGGESYTTLFERNENYTLSWQQYSIGLGAYAGRQIRLRFELTNGSYYTDGGGVWMDDLSVNSGNWYRWTDFAQDTTLASRRFSEQHPELEGQPVHYTILTNELSAGTYTLATILEDAGNVPHGRSPAFTLTVLPLFEHRVEANGTVTLTDYHGHSNRLEIPTVWDGRVVAGIAADALGIASLTNVILPASVMVIEAGSFNGASALQWLFFEGSAPAVPVNGLAGTAATIYYLPGTTGWGASFGGRPARLWNPKPSKNAAFGFMGGHFGFTLSGTALIPLRAQTTASLMAGEWTTLTNAVLDASGSVFVSDPDSPAHAMRFYRCVWP